MNDSGKVGQDVNFLKIQLKVQKLLPPQSHFPKTSSGPDWADSGPPGLTRDTPALQRFLCQFDIPELL